MTVFDDDFGFSFESEVDNTSHLSEIDSLKDKLKESKQNLEGLHKEIIRFLENLKKSPDKPTIKWPNRVKDIDNYIQKLNKYVEGIE